MQSLSPLCLPPPLCLAANTQECFFICPHFTITHSHLVLQAWQLSDDDPGAPVLPPDMDSKQRLPASDSEKTRASYNKKLNNRTDRQYVEGQSY
mmetsp:Transcript_12931/g.19889  ORF Transcript_12931/g.19889 Transcript_12931/m.19889 type:complete len:94 (-) Transcript_12931:1705-1986(-)